MTRPLLLFGFLATLALIAGTAGAEAATRATLVTPGAVSLSLAEGTGRAVVWGRGSLIGNVARGRLAVTNNVAVRGCEVKIVEPHRTVCRGFGLRLYVFGGTWRVRMKGTGINVSGVVRGYLRLKGTAGTYSIAGRAERRWPRTLRTFKLGPG